MSLLEYQRSGGRPPANAERLVIEDDGGFSMRRTVGGERIGSFAGKVPASALAALKKRITEAEGEVIEKQQGRPPQVLERIVAGGADRAFGREQKLPPKLRALAKQLRELLESLTSQPVAALELKLAEDASSFELSAIGEAPADADLSAATALYNLFDEREAFLSSGEIDLPDTLKRTSSPAPGWKTRLDLPALEFNPQRTLQVRVAFTLKGDDGIARQAELAVTAGKGWT